jgi:hypothetical protein
MAPVVLACSLALAAGPGAALAQGTTAPNRERLVAARELMVVVGSAKQFDTIMPLMTAQMTKAFVGLAPHAEKQIQEVMGEMLKRFSARKGELLEQIAGLFAEKLTVAETRELIRFYSTGVGAKFIAMQPEMMQRSALLGQRWGEKIGREIEVEVRRELKKRGINI